MHRQIRTARRALVAGFALLMIATPAIGAASAATPWTPTGLSAGIKALALSSMSETERHARGSTFSSDRYVVVAYSRTVQSFDASTGTPVGSAQSLAIGQAAPAATAAITNLTITIAVAFDRQAPAYRWDISDYFSWSNRPPNAPLGKDQLATAWANGLALNSDYAYGYYVGGNAISMNRNDVTPNVGTSWEFDECLTHMVCIPWASYGYLTATIKESTAHNDATNVVFKYFYTYASNSYGISFAAGAPTISISPTQSETSTVVYASFND